ncbi:MAG: hypothetical protein ACQEUZ_00615 [Pseudomonadota bacterium]
MPLPVALAPWAMKAALGAASAALVWQAARRARWSEARPAGIEDALDGLDHGLAVGWSRDAHRTRGDVRGAWRGILRFGDHGPGLAVDFSGLARLRVARLPAMRKQARTR